MKAWIYSLEKNGIHLSRFLNSTVPINIFKLYSSVLIKNRRIYESFDLIFIGPIYYRWYDIYLSINRWIYETQAAVRDRLYYSVNMSTPIFYSVYKSIVSICIISYAVVRNFFLWLWLIFLCHTVTYRCRYIHIYIITHHYEYIYAHPIFMNIYERLNRLWSWDL
jgi:hypothetical protein